MYKLTEIMYGTVVAKGGWEGSRVLVSPCPPVGRDGRRAVKGGRGGDRGGMLSSRTELPGSLA